MLRRSISRPISNEPKQAANKRRREIPFSLLLDYENDNYFSEIYKDFSGAHTFTRASTGTYADASGVLQVAATDVHRLDYRTGRRGLRMERNETNILIHSDDINSWITNSGATVTQDADAGPYGDGQGDQLNVAASSFSGKYKSGMTTAAATDCAFSYAIKHVSGTSTKLKLGSDSAAAFGSSSAALVTFDTATKTFSNIGTQVVDYGYETVGDLDHVWLVATTTAGSANTTMLVFNGDGANTGSFIIGAVQLEAESFPTSPIPTNGAAATRALDSCLMSGTDFSDWFDATQGTVVVDFNLPYEPSSGYFPYLFMLHDGTLDNRFYVFYNTGTGNISGTVKSGGVTRSQGFSGAYTVGSDGKLGFTWDATSQLICLDGGVVDEDSLTGALPTVDTLQVGAGAGNLFPLNGVLYSLTYWPTKFTAAQLQGLTT